MASPALQCTPPFFLWVLPASFCLQTHSHLSSEHASLQSLVDNLHIPLNLWTLTKHRSAVLSWIRGETWRFAYRLTPQLSKFPTLFQVTILSAGCIISACNNTCESWMTLNLCLITHASTHEMVHSWLSAPDQLGIENIHNIRDSTQNWHTLDSQVQLN